MQNKNLLEEINIGKIEFMLVEDLLVKLKKKFGEYYNLYLIVYRCLLYTYHELDMYWNLFHL